METLSGTVDKLIYSQDDGYAVLSLRIADRLLPATVVGNLAGVQVGEELTVSGRWMTHSRFGEQFKVLEFRAAPPETEEGILRYLSSGAITGIGAGLAQRLVDALGLNLFELAEQDPLVLMQVPGIGKKRAKKLATALAENRATRDAMIFLQGLGLGPLTAARIHRAWEDHTVDRVKADPYRLVRDVEGIGFATADGLAQRLGVQHDAPSRLAAGLLHLLQEAREGGNTVIGQAQAIGGAAAFLEADELEVQRALDELVSSRTVLMREGELEPLVGLPPLVYGEEGIAKELGRLSAGKRATVSADDVTRAMNIELTDEQRNAVIVAASNPVVVITGGPGTGKTTVIRTLVRLLAKRRQQVFLCAPTGRAAKRLSEASDLAATTVHRLLGYRSAGFAHTAESPLRRGTVVLDEASMVDVLLMRRLLEAIPQGGRLVLVGDADQLPSVGAGNVLADLIACQELPIARLSTIFRQAETSRIVYNAHRICRGELPEPSDIGATRGGDFHIVYVDDPERAQRKVVEVCCEHIPRAFKLDPITEVQVLSPMHRGLVGTVALNEALQARLNPKGQALPGGGLPLRVGDKVMQVRNDHDRDVFNGDVGRITRLDRAKGVLHVEMNGVNVEYSREQSGQLVHAYCVSIHKSQGSEYPAVVLPLLTQHYMLLQRNLLYTAVTRAKQVVVVVGSQRAIRMAVQRVDPARRTTRLAGLLRQKPRPEERDMIEV